MPNGVCTFFKCIASNSPVCSYVPPTSTLGYIADRLFAGLIIRKDPETMSEIQNCAPVIYGLLNCFPASPLPDVWIVFFRELIDRSKYITQFQPHVLEAEDNTNTNDMGYFPSWRKLCTRGNYAMDKRKSDTRDECSKAYRGHPNLLPGIFTVYCQHGRLALSFLPVSRLFEVPTCPTGFPHRQRRILWRFGGIGFSTQRNIYPPPYCKEGGSGSLSVA